MAFWLPNNGDILSSRSFPPRTVVLEPRSFWRHARFVVPLADASG
jgi:hypothetical protein